VLAVSTYTPLRQAPGYVVDPNQPAPKPPRSVPCDHAGLTTGWSAEYPITLPLPAAAVDPSSALSVLPSFQPNELDPLYLFGCYTKWELEEEPSAGWELLAAVQSGHSATRAHARALLTKSRQGERLEIDELAHVG